MTETVRPLREGLNCTVPSAVAKIVWSRPRPVPSPGQKRVPRWRTMISPPVTFCPAKTLTPSMFGFDSRPLRLEPRPFLCAISGLLFLLSGFFGRRFLGSAAHFQLSHLEPGQLGAMAGAAAVALLRLVFEDFDLRPAQVLGDGRLDRDLCQLLGLGDDILVAEHDRPQLDLGALIGIQAVDDEGGALLDLVLLSTDLYDCVHAPSSSLLCVERDLPAPPWR